MKESEKIELRSEKVKNIVGEIPKAFNKTGIILVTLLTSIVSFLLSSIYYPISTNAYASVLGNRDDITYIKIMIPYRDKTFAEEGAYIKFVIRDISSRHHKSFEGNITHIDDSILKINQEEYFSILVEFDAKGENIKKENNKITRVTLSNNNLINRLLNKSKLNK